MSAELAVALVAGLFGLVLLMVQIATTRAQRRDRMSRLNQLQAELELLERLHTLQGEVSPTDESAKPQTDPVIRDSLSKVLEQYNKLSEIPSPAVDSDKASPPRQLSLFRRVFLLYRPRSVSGWIRHTIVYVIASYVVMVLVLALLASIV
jgi:hypothetical protein